jgi:anionic cell wall polymer biosynthesis LytR-Cps2A-Psr (LCP) family protein
LGGVEINVPYDMNYDDPTQDLHIHLSKGKHHLDGKQAEGFARFRMGYREDGSLFEIGDEGRKNNQINLIKEIIKQHGTLSNIDKIPKVLGILGKNVKHSIGLGDVLQSYIGLAKDVVTDKYKIEGVNLRSKQIRIDGSSYIDFE